MGRVQERDQVVQHDGGVGAAIEGADRHHGVVHIAFKQAGDEHRVGLQLGDEVFADAFTGAGAHMVADVVFGGRAGHVEHADTLIRHQAGKGGAHRGNCVRQAAIEYDPDLMLARVAGHAQRQRQRIAPDATETAGRLRALEVNHDAHY